MNCNDAHPLIPSYLDGELSEAQAGPLRKHLLACQTCRTGAQSDKNLKRWFVASAAVPVPRDFAARVARRAFAGDRGLETMPALVASSERGLALAHAHSATELTVRAGRAAPALEHGVSRHGASQPDGRIFQFVLRLTAVAATLLFVFAIAMRQTSLPSGEALRADTGATLTNEQVLERLEKLNRRAPNEPTALEAARPEARPAVGETHK